jgi:rhamnosyltransferase
MNQLDHSSNNASIKRCICVLVTYGTERQVLEATLNSIVPQVQGLVIVDNSSEHESREIKLIVEKYLKNSDIDVQVIQLGRNLGIAFAQNAGVDVSETLGADYVLFSDHDTLFPHGAVAELQRNFEDLVNEGRPVACVGPSYVNSNDINCTSNLFINSGWRLRPASLDRDVVEVSFLISSGMFTSMDVLRRVGGLNAGYFIDWVDVEWCFRARWLGYGIYGCPKIKLYHRLGDKVHVLFGKTVVEHNSFRNYHKVRNAIFLSKSIVVDGIGVRLWLLKSAVVNSVLIPIVCSPRLDQLKACIRGLVDGVFRKPHL